MLGVVVPSYNCSEAAIDLVQEIASRNVGPIYLIDDASDIPISSQFTGGSRVSVIRNDHNLGYSQSVIKGMSAAVSDGCSAVATIDGDAAHLVDDLHNLARAWRPASCSLLIGDRMRSRSFRSLPTKLLANQISSALISLCFGGLTTAGRDVSCGLRIYRRDLIEALRYKQVERYGLCYSSIFLATSSQQTITWAPIEVRYPPNQFHFTKQIEFADLLSELSSLNTFKFDLTTLIEAVNSKSSFNVTLPESSAFALFLEPFNGYFFRSIDRTEDGFETVRLDEVSTNEI